tara:strand:+ start:393 stop:617 length:225 start_codon:yes stop_codon:yes gene_type:complete
MKPIVIEKLEEKTNLKTSEIKQLLDYHKKEFKYNEENYNDKMDYWHHSDSIEMYSSWLNNKTITINKQKWTKKD